MDLRIWGRTRIPDQCHQLWVQGGVVETFLMTAEITLQSEAGSTKRKNKEPRGPFLWGLPVHPFWDCLSVTRKETLFLGLWHLGSL